jgi:hypothetical protein
MTTISTTETAKIIRNELKAAFGTATKFSVTSKRYAGGSSINVSWTDGPTAPEVDKVIGHFEGSSFDGMQDLRTPITCEYNGETVRFENHYTFTNRRNSNALMNTVKALMIERFPQIIKEGYFNEYETGAPYWTPDISHTSGIDWGREFYHACHIYDAITGQFIHDDLLNHYGQPRWQHIPNAIEEVEEDEVSEPAPVIVREPVAIYPTICTPKSDVFVTAKFALLNKRSTLAEYQAEIDAKKYRDERCKVVKIASMTTEEWDAYTVNLLESFDFIDGEGGSESAADLPQVDAWWQLTEEQQQLFKETAYNLVVAITAPARPVIYANPEGHSYTRYLGI